MRHEARQVKKRCELSEAPSLDLQARDIADLMGMISCALGPKVILRRLSCDERPKAQQGARANERIGHAACYLTHPRNEASAPES